MDNENFHLGIIEVAILFPFFLCICVYVYSSAFIWNERQIFCDGIKRLKGKQ
jgi:hypothetical protein